MEGIPDLEQQEAMLAQSEHYVKNVINRNFPKGEGHTAFRRLVKETLPKMRNTPASAKVDYHSAWTGGLLVHTAEVIKTALGVFDLLGPDLYSTEHRDDLCRSIIKCGYLHDLGKLGNLDYPYYEIQENEWRKENLGETFTINRDTSQLPYLPVPVRAVWIAQSYGVNLSEIETQAIVASDGQHTPLGKAVIASLLQHPLTMLIHFADLWSSQARGI